MGTHASAHWTHECDSDKVTAARCVFLSSAQAHTERNAAKCSLPQDYKRTAHGARRAGHRLLSQRDWMGLVVLTKP
eukprot:3035260-Prymnesium_polylepis.1